MVAIALIREPGQSLLCQVINAGLSGHGFLPRWTGASGNLRPMPVTFFLHGKAFRRNVRVLSLVDFSGLVSMETWYRRV